MSLEIIIKTIIQDIGENERSKKLIEFLDNKKFGVRQIGHDSYNYTLNNCETFLREDDTFTSDYDKDATVLYLIIPDIKSHSGTFYAYDDLSENTEELIKSHVWNIKK